MGDMLDHGERRWMIRVKGDGPSGTRPMMWWTFARALETDCERLIYCEDDLLLSPGAIDRIRAVQVPDDHAFITFYDHKEFPAGEPRPTDGLHSIEGMGRHNRGMWGSLCVLFPRRTLEYIVTRGPFEWHDPWPHKKTAGDCVMTWALLKSPWPRWMVHVPNLIDHAGVDSSIEVRRIRTTSWFDGKAAT